MQGGPADVFYPIWLSEIMLQQTRVEAVIPYYQRFIDRFPSIESLASAEERDVLAAWSGLGYYSRARNLQHAAKQLAASGLPSTYDEIRALRGIGDYTAAALASIALHLPHAAVDGNVIRVVTRLTNDGSEVTASGTRRRIAETAASLLDRKRPGDFNQAMMELGATVCLPATPRCDHCPIAKFCAATQAGTERQLPVKLNKKTVRHVPLDLAIVERDGHILLVKRSSTERRLAGFWELPAKPPRQRGRKLAQFRHQIVNDRFQVTVWGISMTGSQTPPGPVSQTPPGQWIPAADLHHLPLTTVTKKALAARSLVIPNVNFAKTAFSR